MSNKDIPDKLQSIERLEALLDFLNARPNRYVRRSEIEKGLGKKFDNNALSYALGINDKLPPANKAGIPDPKECHTASYLADIAQIRQTKFIDVEMVYVNHSKSKQKENGYMLTPRGIELLNQIHSVKYSKGILTSSKNLEWLTWILILATIVLLLVTLPNSFGTICGSNTICNGFGRLVETAFSLILIALILWKLIIIPVWKVLKP